MGIAQRKRVDNETSHETLYKQSNNQIGVPEYNEMYEVCIVNR